VAVTRTTPRSNKLNSKRKTAGLKGGIKAASGTNIQFIEPMYALTVRSLPEGPDWLYEIKLDGYRCLAGRDAGGVSLWSRRGNVFTLQFPAIAKACELLPTGTLVDGEIVAMDSNGKVSFNTLQRHRSEASAIRFYVFDLLILRGRSMLHEPLLKRRGALTELLGPVRKKSSAVDLSQTVSVSAQEMIRAVTELGFEGIMAKRQDSLYEPGKRSGAWVKYKINKGQEFVTGGYTPGNPFDAIIVGYYKGDKLYYARKVRAGFVPHVRREVMAKMKTLKTDVCPFVNLPEKKGRTQWALTADEMKNCVWLKPELVVQIEFTEWTPADHLRHAAFVGLRRDKKAQDVVRESA
jgi:DNA ligase D-like protein (predicted ligase)